MDEQKDGYLNYYLAHTDSNGVTGVFGNQRLITKDIYTNIDLMYSSNQNGIKYYFIVKPGGNPADIQLTFTGASSFSLNGTSNELSINSSIGSLTYDRPTAYQLTAGNATVAITGWTPDWQTNGAANKYKFNLGAYTSSLTLIIEVDQGNAPIGALTTANPVWCTHYGAPNYDQVYQIDSDNSGNLYVTGYATDISFPVTSGIFSPSGGGSHDSYLLKFSPFGVPQWRTFYGGTGIDDGFDVKVDNTSNFVYMVGYTGDPGPGTTSTNFPLKTVSGSYNHSASSSAVPLYYGFISKFNMNTGNRLWATLFGEDVGPSQTYIESIDISSSGELYIAGSTIKNSTFPIVTPSNGCTVHSQNITGVQSGFIAKFDMQNQIVWSTTFGNDGTFVSDIKLNSQNELFITGSTTSTNANSFPLAQEFTNDIMNSFSGGTYDAFVSKFNSCFELKWSTLFGGDGDEKATAIEISEGASYPSKMQNNVTHTYICGLTDSDNTLFPILSNGNANSVNDNSISGQDGFISAFDGANELKWSTYVGGSNTDMFYDMEFGKSGILFLTGASKSTDFLSVSLPGSYNQAQLENTAGGNDFDAIILALDGPTNFSKTWSTWLGGNTSIPNYRSDDYGFGITTKNNYIYIGGRTWSYNNFPWNADLTNYPSAYYQPYLAGNFSQDGFLAQIDLGQTPISVKEINKKNDDELLIFPNPSTGIVEIKLPEEYLRINDNIDIQIFDIHGRELITKKVILKNTEISLNLSELSTGMYFIKLNGENLNKSQKVVIYH